jgi:arylsulfatase A-like enzyme
MTTPLQKPNIIYFHTHDTGRYISPYGYHVPSPNYQRLAAEGLTFKHMHSVSPTCSPSRAALLTGEYPHQNGMISLAHKGAKLNDMNSHLVHTLKPNGYHTVLIGFHHVINWPEFESLGYDEYRQAGSGAHGPKIAAEALDFLDHQDSEQPFFASIGISETHRVFPSEVPEGAERYLRPPAPFPDTDVYRKDMAAYIESLKYPDAALGQILDKLEETGMRENTLIICTTDHGVAFPSMKNNLTDHGTGVLFILSGPGIAQGTVTDAIATQLDVFPTICDFTGIEKPERLEGKSLLPLVNNETKELHEVIFTESNYHGYGYHPFRCIRDGRYAYIEGFEDNEWSKFPRSDASPTDEAWTKAGWGAEVAPKERLFDTTFDPHEVNNLSQHPAYQEIKTRLQSRLLEHLKATNDPILNGPIPAPEGATHE